MITRESAALSAWYGSRGEVRRLWAFRDEEGLRVLVHLEPAQDSGEIHPAWVVNHRAWVRELEWRTGSAVRLENADELFSDDAPNGAGVVMVVALSWRDPASSQ